MATYAIGDVQGCHATLVQLVDRISFDRRSDHLWFVGDLVNRGPASLATLRWVRDLGERATVVLGNHDLHLLALAAGVRHARPLDTLDEVLEAADRDDLLRWLRARPLLHREDPYVLVHAGLLPSWTVAQAAELAAVASAALRSDEETDLLRFYQQGVPQTWRDDLEPTERIRTTITALTRLRTCSPDGVPCLDYTGPPGAAPDGCLPWFSIPGRSSADAVMVFGHWSALGLIQSPEAIALDTGCVWGGTLTAVRLEDGGVFQEPRID